MKIKTKIFDARVEQTPHTKRALVKNYQFPGHILHNIIYTGYVPGECERETYLGQWKIKNDEL